MKYLKTYEAYESMILSKSEIEYHLDEIKNIFQDYIDEYNIEELDRLSSQYDGSKSGIFYHICHFNEIDSGEVPGFRNNYWRPTVSIGNGNIWRPQFQLELYCQSTNDEEEKIIWNRYFKLIKEDISKYIERLKEVGYFVSGNNYPNNLEELVKDDEFNILISLKNYQLK